MKYLYHYTSNKIWERLQRSGFLSPMTHPFEVKYLRKFISKKARKVAVHKKYIVGLPNIKNSGWVRYGLWKELMKWKHFDVVLKVKLPKNAQIFVREHKYCSPRFFIEKFGKNLAEQASKGKLNKSDRKNFDSCMIEYYNSTTPFSKYKNNFEVPEIWLANKVPLGSIRCVRLKKKI